VIPAKTPAAVVSLTFAAGARLAPVVTKLFPTPSLKEYAPTHLVASTILGETTVYTFVAMTLFKYPVVIPIALTVIVPTDMVNGTVYSGLATVGVLPSTV
jgi:hypothetical protein